MQNPPQQQQQQDQAPPPPPPWAFHCAYQAALPQHVNFDPATGFANMVGFVGGLPAQYPDAGPRIVPVVATYPNAAAKNRWTGLQGLSDAERQEYQAGATLSVAQKSFVAGGSVGLVTSNMSSASAQAQGANDWHTVAMARQGNTVWVHDPAYSAAAFPGGGRIDAVNGNRMVHQLVHGWPNVAGAYYQGPPAGYAAGQQDCMGRSAQWVEATASGQLPWPPNLDPSGGDWVWHTRN